MRSQILGTGASAGGLDKDSETRRRTGAAWLPGDSGKGQEQAET